MERKFLKIWAENHSHSSRGSNRELHLHVLLIATLMEGTNLAYKRHFAFNFLFFYLLSLLFLYTSFFSHLFLFISSFVILFFLLSLSSFFKVSPAIFFTHLSFLPLEGALLSPCDVEIQKIISVPNNGEKHWQVLIPQVVKSATFSGKRGHITCDDLQPVATISCYIGDWLLKEYLSELGGAILGWVSPLPLKIMCN